MRSHFLATIKHHVVLTSIRIKRVQNPALLDQYLLLGESMQYQNQMWLWHGTDSASIRQICENGFNRSFSGKNATAYGKGCYFAKDARYSNEYASRDRSSEKRRMILAWVLVGRSCLGRPDMKAPPDGYQSTSNAPDARYPIFVTYKDAQSYPAWVITYRTE